MFPDPRPLVERLGRDFFLQAPDRPGVYLMRDAADTVLYVGKAKSLRKRLNAYRVANPDRMARRHLRLLRAVARIELQECADESSALARESELLRTLKPRFNRAGTWPAPPQFLVWRRVQEQLELAVSGAPESGWAVVGLGTGAFFLRTTLVRLLWFALHPGQGTVGMPLGWVHGRLGERAVIILGSKAEEVTWFLEKLVSGETEVFCDWVRAKFPADVHRFEKAIIGGDLEFLADARLLRPSQGP